MSMVLGDKDDGDNEEFICKWFVRTRLVIENQALLIKLLKGTSEPLSFSVDNQKYLAISLVTAFHKGFGLPLFVVDICDITASVKTTPSSCFCKTIQYASFQ